jgi:hypothetical protein
MFAEFMKQKSKLWGWAKKTNTLEKLLLSFVFFVSTFFVFFYAVVWTVFLCFLFHFVLITLTREGWKVFRVVQKSRDGAKGAKAQKYPELGKLRLKALWKILI